MDKEDRKRGSLFIVARKKLNDRFHNPNTVETTADYILKVFMEVNEKKVERAMQEAAENVWEENDYGEKREILD